MPSDADERCKGTDMRPDDVRLRSDRLEEK